MQRSFFAAALSRLAGVFGFCLVDGSFNFELGQHAGDISQFIDHMRKKWMTEMQLQMCASIGGAACFD